MKALLAPVNDDVGIWLEHELERMGISAAQRRRTRLTLASRLASAMRGQFVAYPPHEALVLEAAARDMLAFEPPSPPPPSASHHEISSKLQQLSDDVAFLQLREQASEVRDAYRRRVARREEKIRDLQMVVQELQDELHETRENASRTQQKLEDALLERSVELTDLKARLQRSEAQLAVQERHKLALQASSEQAFEAAMLARTAPTRMAI